MHRKYTRALTFENIRQAASNTLVDAMAFGNAMPTPDDCQVLENTFYSREHIL